MCSPNSHPTRPPRLQLTTLGGVEGSRGGQGSDNWVEG